MLFTLINFYIAEISRDFIYLNFYFFEFLITLFFAIALSAGCGLKICRPTVGEIAKFYSFELILKFRPLKTLFWRALFQIYLGTTFEHAYTQPYTQILIFLYIQLIYIPCICRRNGKTPHSGHNTAHFFFYICTYA